MYVDAYKCKMHYASNTSNYLSELLSGSSYLSKNPVFFYQFPLK